MREHRVCTAGSCMKQQGFHCEKQARVHGLVSPKLALYRTVHSPNYASLLLLVSLNVPEGRHPWPAHVFQICEGLGYCLKSFVYRREHCDTRG
jgi:hypothetical protein